MGLLFFKFSYFDEVDLIRKSYIGLNQNQLVIWPFKGVPPDLVDMSQIQANFGFLLIRLLRSSWRQPCSLKPRGSGLTVRSIKIRLFVNNGILAFKLGPYSKSNTLNLVVIFIFRSTVAFG